MLGQGWCIWVTAVSSPPPSAAHLPHPLPLDWQTARAYHAIPPASQENLHQLIALLLREFATSTPQSLLRLMDAMSREAAENGLDEATLAQLLQDE